MQFEKLYGIIEMNKRMNTFLKELPPTKSEGKRKNNKKERRYWLCNVLR